jgi:hypothetical protein
MMPAWRLCADCAAAVLHHKKDTLIVLRVCVCMGRLHAEHRANTRRGEREKTRGRERQGGGREGEEEQREVGSGTTRKVLGFRVEVQGVTPYIHGNLSPYSPFSNTQLADMDAGLKTQREVHPRQRRASIPAAWRPRLVL